MNDNSAMRVALLLSALLLFGCHRGTPKLSNEEVRKIHAEIPGMTFACLEKWRWGGVAALPHGTEECFEMLPAAFWRGLWVDDEGWPFCAAPATECTGPGTNWMQLEFKDDDGPLPQGAEPGGVYEIRFIGRRTAHGGIYGDGPDRQVLVVDKLFSLKQVEAPPAPMTKAEEEAEERRCEAAPNCLTPREMQELVAKSRK